VKPASANKAAKGAPQGNTCDKSQKPCLNQPQEGDTKVSGNLEANPPSGAIVSLEVNDKQLPGVSGQLQKDVFTFANLHPLNQYDTVEVIQTSPPPPANTAPPTTGKVSVKPASANKAAQGGTQGNTCDKSQKPCLNQPQEGDTSVSGSLEANPPSGAVVSIKLNDVQIPGVSGQIESGAFTFTNLHPLSQYDTIEVIQTSPPVSSNAPLPTTGRVSVKPATSNKLTIPAASASLDFGHQAMETASATKTVTLTNSTTNDIDIEDPLTTVTSRNYLISSNSCVGTIAKKANCTFNVAFTPFSSGPTPGAVERDFVVIVPKNAQSLKKFRDLLTRLNESRQSEKEARIVWETTLQRESRTQRNLRISGPTSSSSSTVVVQARTRYLGKTNETNNVIQEIETEFQVISLSGIPDHWTYPLTRAVVGIQLSAPSAQAVKQAYLVDFDLLAPLKLPGLPKNEDPIENRLWVWFNPQITSLPQAANFSALSTINETGTFITGESSKGTLGDIQGLSTNAGVEFVIVKPRDGIPWWAQYANTQARLSPSLIVGGGFATPFSVNNTDVISQANQSICDAFSANVPPKKTPPTVSGPSGLVCQPGTSPSTSPVIIAPGGSTKSYIDFFTPERSRFFSQFNFGLRLKTYFFSKMIKGDCIPSTGRGETQGDCDGLYNIFPGIIDLTFGKNEAVTAGHLSTWVFGINANYPLPFYQGIHLFASMYTALTSNSASQPYNAYTINTPTTGANNDANTFRYGLQPLNRDYYTIGVGVDLVQVFKKASSGGQPNSKAPAPASNPSPAATN
jgi:hypothetical protein